MQGTSTLTHRRPPRHSDYVNLECCVAPISSVSGERSLAIPVVSGLSRAVHQILSNGGFDSGILLLQQIRATTLLVDQGISHVPQGISKRDLDQGIRALHACLLHVDFDLMEQETNPLLEDTQVIKSCSSWLQQLQSFVLAMQRGLEDLPEDAWGSHFKDPMTDKRSEGFEVGGPLRLFFSSALEQLAKVVEAMDEWEMQERCHRNRPTSPTSLSAVEETLTSSCRGRGSLDSEESRGDGQLIRIEARRLVCARSHLNYKIHWYGKISL